MKQLIVLFVFCFTFFKDISSDIPGQTLTKNKAPMGVGRVFSRGAIRGFFQNFSRGWAKSGEICFFPLENNQTTFFAEISLPPSDAHESIP